jgi:hypothetical protein
MDIQNNSVVIDVDTEILDSEIDQISNYLSETHYFDNEQEEELELLVAKAMKLGELYERKKWQAAKAQAVPEGFVLVPKEPTDEIIEAMNEFDYRNDYSDMDGAYRTIVETLEKAQAVPDQLDVNSILHDIDCYFDNGLSNTERTANNLLQSIYEKLSGEVKAQEPAND